MKQFFRNNGFLILIAALLLTGVLAVGSFLLGGDPIADALSFVTTPFRNLASAAAEWVEDRYDRAFRYDALVQTNEELREQIAALEQTAREGEDAIRQNERYRDLLGLKQKRADFVFEEAEITQRAVSGWQYTMTLNKGSRQDVAEDDCVVDQYGNLVGIISEVGYNWSTLATMVDPTTEIGGRIPRTDDEAVLEGDFTLMLEGKLKLAYLPENTIPISGDQVTTSGLGDQYPAGLVVGTIESIHTEANGLTRYAVVEPAADLDGIRYVFVIKSFDVVQ